MARARNDKIPALVVSGFLGSGKTSLVRHLLAQAVAEGLRIAVVSNEFGELGIDRELLGGGGEAFVELEGGCVCCELSDDLVETLQQLRNQVDPDRIVVETSGVALPFDTQLNFWREPVSEWIGDDMAVVVVNALQVAEERDLEGTFTDQLSSADLVVLNQVDLVEASALPGIEDRLREIEPEAPIVRCEHGGLDTRLLFPSNRPAPDRNSPPPKPPPHTHERFVSDSIAVEPGTAPAQLEELLHQPGLLRAKGFVETLNGMQLVQVVGRRIEWTPSEAPDDPELRNRVVFIRRANRNDG
ncbi:MAG: GTP-binding protein [Myxococcota bacterium]|nr:GTP-binding protein [Myxococcota bacterium]